MYTTKVNVNDLVIDMPLDEGNVAQKMESLKAGGLVQPVTVWLQDFRIIDGFHRTEAAKRLGWTEIDCVVKDCDEETFWDARIQSARQHHKVTDERMVAWVHECWQQTEWYAEADGNENLTKQISQVLWNIAKDEYRYSSFLGLAAIDHPIIAWVNTKAHVWQYPQYELCRLLMNTFKHGHQSTIEQANKTAAQLEMDNRTRLDFVDQIRHTDISEKRWGGRITSEDLHEYGKHFVSTPKPERQDVYKFRKEREEKEYQKRVDEVLESQRKRNEEHKQHAQWLQSEEGKRAKRQQVKSDFSVKISALRAHVADNRTDFAELSDGYEILMSLSAWAATKAAELFPEREQPTEVQLRRELADAYRQIESLQKALDSRKEYRQRLPKVLAYSSTEISKAN